MTSALLCVSYQSDFSKTADPTESERLFRPIEAARQGEFDFGTDLSKRKAFFSKKKCSDTGTGSDSLQSVCAKITSSQTIAVEHCSVQKLHSSANTLLQIFDLIFTGSQVATHFCDVTYIPYLLRTCNLSTLNCR